MAVTLQNSVEYANTLADPVVNNSTTEFQGRMRVMFFTHDQSGVGDAGSSVALGKLPPGRIRIISALSRVYVNWTTAGQTLDVGWDAYTNTAGTAVVADPDGLVDGLDVESAGYFTLEGALAGVKASGGTFVFESKTGVVIRATSKSDKAIADGDDLVGYIVYVAD